MMRQLLAALALSALAISCESEQTASYEWDKYPVPADAGEGMVWELQAQSDDFNYTSPATHKSAEFLAKWTDFYHGNWSGPKPTEWLRENVKVEDGYLQIWATRDHDRTTVISSGKIVDKTTPITNTGCITSRERVVYPAYIETYAKISNSVLASDVWMLSPDDTQEIDILEAYGSDRDGGGYGADRLHLSHHVFIRSPFQDYQPHDAGSWHRDEAGTIWREEFHRIGVHWRDPFNLDYYVDGKLVRSVSGMDIIDPKGFTEGKGLHKAMDIIINMEDQTWRAAKGITPTEEELKNREDHTMKIDWIRIYKPVSAE